MIISGYTSLRLLNENSSLKTTWRLNISAIQFVLHILALVVALEEAGEHEADCINSHFPIIFSAKVIFGHVCVRTQNESS